MKIEKIGKKNGFDKKIPPVCGITRRESLLQK